MHKLTAHDAETQSLDGVADNIAKLTALFPEILTEGADGGKRVDFAALRELLGTAVEDKEERYNFTWHGKAQARRLAQTPLRTPTFRPYRHAARSRSIHPCGGKPWILRLRSAQNDAVVPFPRIALLRRPSTSSMRCWKPSYPARWVRLS